MRKQLIIMLEHFTTLGIRAEKVCEV